MNLTTRNARQSGLLSRLRLYKDVWDVLPFFIRLAFLMVRQSENGFDNYARHYCHPEYVNKHRFLLRTSLRGLGILNYKTPEDSGEIGFVSAFLRDLDNEDSLVVDVGANSGEFASLVLRSTRKIKVISYEPNPSSCKACRSNLAAYGDRWSIIEKAIGNECTQTVMWDYSSDSGSPHASLYKEVIENVHHSEATSIHITQTTIDNELGQSNLRIALLKYDIEGHELKALEGSSEVIRKYQPKAILIEFNEMNAVSSASFYRISQEIGHQYEPYRLLPEGRLLPLGGLPIVETELYAFQNIVFLIKPGSDHTNRS
jgi:FkbM family methyltransferase